MLKLKKTRVGIQHCSAEMSLHNFRCAHARCGDEHKTLSSRKADSSLLPRKGSGAGPRGYSVELPVEGTALRKIPASRQAVVQASPAALHHFSSHLPVGKSVR